MTTRLVQLFTISGRQLGASPVINGTASIQLGRFGANLQPVYLRWENGKGAHLQRLIVRN
jgi:hypothetical protein